MPGQRGRLDSTELPDSNVVVARETKSPSKQEAPDQSTIEQWDTLKIGAIEVQEPHKPRFLYFAY